MKINYLGHACFKIEFSDGISVVCDPFTKIGYEMQETSANILTCSHKHYDHYCIEKVKNDCLLEKSGEYSFSFGDKILKITGIDSWHDEKRGALRGGNVIYKFEYDGITLAHMGDIGEDVSDGLLEKIGKIDILLIPVGGTYTVDANGATKWVEKISPKIIIPMHYKQKTCDIDIVGVEKFLKLNVDKKITRVDGWVEINNNSLTQDKTEIIEMAGEKMTDYQEEYKELYDYLDKINIHVIRCIAREFGASEPSHGRKGALIERTVRVCAGIDAPQRTRTKNGKLKGAPPKEVADKEKIEAVKAIVNKIKANKEYDYDQETENIVLEDSKKGKQRGYGSTNVVRGFVDFDLNGNAFLVVQKGLSYDSIVIPSGIVETCKLRRGDKLNAYYDETDDGGIYVGEVMSINGMTVQECKKRLNFDDFTPCYVERKINFADGDKKLKAIDLITPLGKGQRAIISAPALSGKSSLIKRMVESLIKSDSKLSISVLLNAVRPEEITAFKRMRRVELFSTTFDDSAALQVQIANLAFENAKRLMENGEDVILFVDGLTDLACACGEISGTNVSTSEIKRLFAVARNTDDERSVTVVATIRTDDDEASLTVYRELKKTANMDIALSRAYCEQRVFPPVDFTKSYNYALDNVLSTDEIENISLVKILLAKNVSLSELYNLLETDDGADLASIVERFNR